MKTLIIVLTIVCVLEAGIIVYLVGRNTHDLNRFQRVSANISFDTKTGRECWAATPLQTMPKPQQSDDNWYGDAFDRMQSRPMCGDLK